MFKYSKNNKIHRWQPSGRNRYGNPQSSLWVNFLSPVSRNWLGVALLLLSLAALGGCAAQADRTRELLELDLADRGRATARLETEFGREPAAWRAYSLGVLYGAGEDYNAMNRWFARCSELTDLYDQKIVRIVGEHWRDEARRADAAMAAGRWSAAVEACEKALLADRQRDQTRLRLIEARVMAWGPELEEIRGLAAAGRTEVLDRWLEEMAASSAAENDAPAADHATASATRPTDKHLAVRVRLQAQLAAVDAAAPRPGDAYAAYLIAELARLDRDWPAMDRWYRQTASMLTVDTDLAIDHRPQMAARRRAVADGYLTAALAAWGELRVAQATACLDTAELVDPGRADIVKTRGNIDLLAGASTARAVRTALSLGDLDTDWLVLWMTQLYNRHRRGDAALVADVLLGGKSATAATIPIRQQALRLRSTWRIESGDLPGAAEDLRALLNTGFEDPHTAIVLGDVLVTLSAYAEARHWYDRAELWDGRTADLDARRARVAFSQGLIDQMLHFSEQALAAAPDNPEYRQLLNRAQSLSGEVRP